MTYEDQIKEALGLLGYQTTQQRGAPAASTRKYYNYHEGTDIGTPAKTPIKPNFKGTYLGTVNDTTGYGTREIVYNPQTDQTMYLSHLSGTANLKPGQQFNPGDVIGFTGGVPGTYGAGNTTGAHLDVVTKGGQQAPAYNYATTLANNISKQASRAGNPTDIINKVKQMFGSRVQAVGSNQAQMNELAKKYKNAKVVKVRV